MWTRPSGADSQGWQRLLPLVIVAGLGITFSGVIFYEIDAREQDKAKAALERRAADVTSVLELGIQSNLDAISSIRELFVAIPKVDRRTFRLFAAEILSLQPAVQALEWIPRISAEERAQWEKAARQDGFANFKITEVDNDGSIVPAASRDEYFPVYYVEPYAGNEMVFGLDLASNKERLSAMETARDTGRTTATAGIKLVQDPDQIFGFLIFVPVYVKNAPVDTMANRRDNLRGFALGVFRVGDLVESMLRKLRAPNVLDIYVYDDHALTADNLVYFYSANQPGQSTRPFLKPAGHDGLESSRIVNIAGQTWTIFFKAVPGRSGNNGWIAWGALSGGLLFTVLLVFYLYSVQSRARYIGWQVAKKTRELASANDVLEAEIAERKRAASALLRSEARIRNVLNTVLDGIITIDAKGIIESFNPAAERIFGYLEAEIKGKNVRMLMPEPYQTEHDSYLSNYTKGGDAKVIGTGREVQGLRRDGTTFPAYLAISEMMDDDRKIFTGVIQDITKRKAAEDALKQSHEQLGQRVRERTAELAENYKKLQWESAERIKVEEALRTREHHLRELQYELHTVSRSSTIGQLSSALAHELNQPLAAIMNYLQACRRLVGKQEDNPPTKVSEMIDKTLNQAERAGAIVRGLRDIVHKGETSREIEDINQDIEEATTLGLTGMADKELEVELDLDPELSPILVNKVQIQQVVQNLVRNAAEAVSKSECRQLKVKTSCEHEGLVEISVSDTGPGLTAEVQKRLFQPFTTTKSKGMGVGLAISRTIVEAHGGKIWAESNDRGGMTFRFTIPTNVHGEAAHGE